MTRIAALTCVRNGDRFITRWITHYAAALGAQNLYVLFDGLDQKLPAPAQGAPDWGVNTRHFEHTPLPRLKGDKLRAARASDVAAELLQSYDLVIGTDVDEFLVVDPACGLPLADYLSACAITGSLSALGVDVARNHLLEAPLDWAAPILGQRRFGLLSDRYTKASILARPLRWGSGFHRVKGQGFRIDPNLFLFHFGSVDSGEIDARFDDTERRAAGWTSHQKRRASVSEVITSAKPVDGDRRFAEARALLSRPRSLLAWNKPRPLKQDQVVTLPERFFGLV